MLVPELYVVEKVQSTTIPILLGHFLALKVSPESIPHGFSGQTQRRLLAGSLPHLEAGIDVGVEEVFRRRWRNAGKDMDTLLADAKLERPPPSVGDL